MAPAEYVEFNHSLNEQDAGTSIYFMRPGDTIDSTQDGFKIRGTVFTQQNRRRAVTPDGRSLIFPTKATRPATKP